MRVTQGKEPPAFLRLFGGQMVLHRGGVASGFKSNGAAKTNDAGLAVFDKFPKMFHIRGVHSSECRALQVEPKGKNLNSNDVFVVVGNPEEKADAFVWVGKGANDEEKKLGEALVAKLKDGSAETTTANYVLVKEGEEKNAKDFWSLANAADGGTAVLPEDYASDPCLSDPHFEPRLFQVSNATGALR